MVVVVTQVQVNSCVFLLCFSRLKIFCQRIDSIKTRRERELMLRVCVVEGALRTTIKEEGEQTRGKSRAS